MEKIEKIIEGYMKERAETASALRIQSAWGHDVSDLASRLEEIDTQILELSKLLK